MEFRPIERSAQDFQQSVTAEEVTQICRRVFGANTGVLAAEELAGGRYKNTYRLTVSGRERPVILRIAPEPGRQFESERELLRNEYASMPWLSVIAPMLPELLAADWSHELIGRDWMIQTFLDGVAAVGPRGLSTYDRSAWPAFYRQMGSIAKAVHSVRGPHFGPVTGPACATWSDALTANMETIAADLDDVGLDSTDLRKVTASAAERSAVLDEITVPGMITGDLWIENVLLSEGAPDPTVTGVIDLDRTLWGDPLADWTIRMARLTPGAEAFWDADAYGTPDRSPAAAWRSVIYEARHIGAIQLQYHRLGEHDLLPKTYDDMANVLAQAV